MVFIFIIFLAFFGLGVYFSFFLDKRLRFLHHSFKIKIKRDSVCNREESLNVYLDESFYVTNNVDAALKEFFDIVINRFVVKWYSDVSSNVEFLVELKHNLRVAVNDLLHRLARVDIGHLVVNDVIPLAANHWIACCEILCLGNVGVESSSFDQLLLSRLGTGKHLHCALHSRDLEHSYLLALASSVTSILVGRVTSLTVELTSLLCEILTSGVLLPALDVIANPDFLNKLLILAINGDEVALLKNEVLIKIPLLSAYQEERYRWHYSVASFKNIHMVRKDTHNLLFYFIQYLKSIKRVEVLQFFLDLEQINARLLQADIPLNTLCEIQKELRSLYRCLQPGGLFHSKIHPSKAFTEALKAVTSTNKHWKKILSLQTCEAWFEIHGEICRELEQVYLPLFYQSEEHFLSQVGERHSSVRQNSDNSYWHRRVLLREDALAGEIFFRDGSTRVISISADGDVYGTDEYDDDEVVLSNHEAVNDECEHDQEPVDLSLYQIRIPCLCQVPHFVDGRATGRYCVAYQIEVKIRDPAADAIEQEEPMQWIVQRRIDEFYVLDVRLREFHATLFSSLNLDLPARGIFKHRQRRDLNFLKDYRTHFERYLSDLLTLPFLHHSQLIWSFLTRKEAEELTNGTTRSGGAANGSLQLPTSLSRLASKMKVLKQRSSYLRPFLNAVQANCLSTSIAQEAFCEMPQQQSVDAISDNNGNHFLVSMREKRLHLDMYWNNANLQSSFIRPVHVAEPCRSSPQVHNCCTYDLLVHLILGGGGGGEFQCEAPPLLPLRHPWLSWLLRCLLIGLKPFLHHRLANWLTAYINSKMAALLHEDLLVPIIHLLRDTLFFDNSAPRSKEEKIERRRESLEALLSLFSCPSSIANKEAVHSNITLLHDLLQLPKVNKQLTYALLDIVLLQFFPEVEQK